MKDLLSFFSRNDVHCTTCGRGFRAELTDVPDGSSAIRRQFICPWCGQDYPVARISLRGLELTEELQQTPTWDQERINRLRKEIKKEVTRWAE